MPLPAPFVGSRVVLSTSPGRESERVGPELDLGADEGVILESV